MGKVFKSYKFEILIIIAYVFVMLFLISWGLPNASHPFPYFMDESHILQTARNVVRYGTSNYPHQENGPMFFYVVSLILASPFYFFKFIDPHLITSAISTPFEQAKFYMVFRLTILLFGVLSLVVLVRIARFLKLNTFLVLLFFVVTPVWISISNYFKYDIPFVFWTLISFYLMLLYSVKRKRNLYILAGVTSSLALATKISAVPVLILYIFAFFYFTNKPLKEIKTLIHGLVIYVVTFMLVGIPDIIFLGRSMNEYLYYNIILTPGTDRNYLEPLPHIINLFGNLLSVEYGHAILLLGVISILYLLMQLFRKGLMKNKYEAFILAAIVIFSSSLLPLWFVAANRALVVLPFIVIAIGVVLTRLMKEKSFRVYVILLISIVILAQLYETYSWIDLKLKPNSREMAGNWLIKNIPKKTTIGIENIPVYQMLPDLITSEFYEKSYNIKKEYYFNYEVVDSKTKKLPTTIVLTNSEFEKANVKKSAKKELIDRVYRENYKLVKVFHPVSGLYRSFTTDLAFVVVGLTAYPLEISVYRK